MDKEKIYEAELKNSKEPKDYDSLQKERRELSALIVEKNKQRIKSYKVQSRILRVAALIAGASVGISLVERNWALAFWQALVLFWILYGDFQLFHQNFLNGILEELREVSTKTLDLADKQKELLEEVFTNLVEPILGKQGEYVIIQAGGQLGILHKKCKKISWNGEDVKNLYCGNCNVTLK